MEVNNNDQLNNEVKHITEDDVKVILKHSENLNNFALENFIVYNASDKMLGFLADYWKLKVNLISTNRNKRCLHFFVKAISRSNAAKAQMVKELVLFDKEIEFYMNIKKAIADPDIKPWSPKLVTVINDDMVFEDLNAQNYIVRDKFLRFDKNHTEQALKTIARFHATSIIFEEQKSKTLNRRYSINEDYEQHLGPAGYIKENPWYKQCSIGALEAIKEYSKFAKDAYFLKRVEDAWMAVWEDAIELDITPSERKVICHRDLWNNNLLFHYDSDGKPDDCLLVDFQAARCQPPAADVMLLLYCNLDPKFREEQMSYFLDFYFEELSVILRSKNIKLDDVIPREEFLRTAEKFRKWGLIICACLLPQIWINDELTTEIFCDSDQFDEILSNDKSTFIKKMMLTNNEYKTKVMEIFDEIIKRFCLKK